MATFSRTQDHDRKVNMHNSLARPLWGMCLYPNPDYPGRADWACNAKLFSLLVLVVCWLLGLVVARTRIHSCFELMNERLRGFDSVQRFGLMIISVFTGRSLIALDERSVYFHFSFFFSSFFPAGYN